MWLFTIFGFFSIVQKAGMPHLTIRARVKADLDRLRERYIPELGPTQGKAGTDYPWRAVVPHATLAAAMGKIVMDVTYPNFKSEVAAKQGHARAAHYHQVWDVLFGMPEDPKPARKTTPAKEALPWAKTAPRGIDVAYGGVVIDSEGRVLLREPRGHHDNYFWTWPKGRPDPGESPEATALREVEEETGVHARILAPIPGEFVGGTTINRFFLMVPDGPITPLAADVPETVSVRWALPGEARTLIEMTRNAKGKERDLVVLKAGLKEWAKHHL